jgi:drug/metabolite transporter (DMT)-like permease
MSPVLKVVLAAIIWGSTGAFVKGLQLPTNTVVLFRVLVPAILAAAILALRKEEIPSLRNPKLLLASFINALRLFFYVLTYVWTTMGNAVVVLYAAPIFMALMERFWLKKSLSVLTQVAIVIGFSGVLVVYYGRSGSVSGDQDYLGIISMLISALLYAVTTILFKEELKTRNALQVLYCQNILGVVLFGALFLYHPVWPSLAQCGLGITYGLVIGFTGFMLFFSALKEIAVSHAAGLTYLEVVGGIFMGWLLFDETLTIPLILGAILILGAASLIQIGQSFLPPHGNLRK